MATIRVADEVWIATALLHRQHPERDDFTVGEIIRRAEAEKVAGAGRLRPGVQVHAYLHCVANKAPNPGRYRMLVETAKGAAAALQAGRSVPPPSCFWQRCPRRAGDPADLRRTAPVVSP